MPCSIIEVGPGVFEVIGEIDAYSAPALVERFTTVGVDTLVLDLAGVTFMDSSGLRVVVETFAWFICR